uniref:Uncharacterized protein n=1 Tax=Hyaloperonospora arabidopsidis (strain Emoy2) TaxID=559515 RepID=M4B8S9_HYAAE
MKTIETNSTPRKKDKRQKGRNGQEAAQTSVSLTRGNFDQGMSDSDSDEGTHFFFSILSRFIRLVDPRGAYSTSSNCTCIISFV